MVVRIYPDRKSVYLLDNAGRVLEGLRHREPHWWHVVYDGSLLGRETVLSAGEAQELCGRWADDATICEVARGLHLHPADEWDREHLRRLVEDPDRWEALQGPELQEGSVSGEKGGGAGIDAESDDSAV